jgi:hypothetical protein
MGATEDHPRSQELTPTDLLNPDLRRRATEEFGPDGAWLLLSIVYYSWRAHHDLAGALMRGPEPRPSMPPSPRPISNEYAVVRHLQVLGHVYAAAELFGTLVAASRVHESGTSKFIEAYATARNLTELLPQLVSLQLDELRTIIGTETQIRDAVDAVRAERTANRWTDAPVELGLKSLPVTALDGGLLVPTASVDSRVLEMLQEEALAVAPLVLTNVAELQDLVKEPQDQNGIVAKPQSLRKVDNSFRHGMRIMYHSTVPDVRRFAYVGRDDVPEDDTQVTVYLPSKDDSTIQFGGVSCGADETQTLLRPLEQLCIRTGQFAWAFIGAHCSGFESLILSAGTLRLPDDGSA